MKIFIARFCIIGLEILAWCMMASIFLGAPGIFQTASTNILPVFSWCAFLGALVGSISIFMAAARAYPCEKRKDFILPTCYIVSNVTRMMVFFAFGWYWYGLSAAAYVFMVFLSIQYAKKYGV
jgi:hypothetical protein